MTRLAASLLLVAMLAFSPLRLLLESSMRSHMLVQLPLLMAAGAGLATALPAHAKRRLAAFNALGLSGLTLMATLLGIVMIPRLLDLAIREPWVDACKFAAMLSVGAVAHASWRAAGPVVQAFFVGTLLPMSVAIGSIYQEAPVRLCNAYRLDDQQRLGTELIVLACVMTLLWLGVTLHSYARPRR